MCIACNEAINRHAQAEYVSKGFNINDDNNFQSFNISKIYSKVLQKNGLNSAIKVPTLLLIVGFYASQLCLGSFATVCLFVWRVHRGNPMNKHLSHVRRQR